LTQNQLTELLETESARTLMDGAEERGYVESTQLEAFALEHELSALDVEELRRELERLGMEIREAEAAAVEEEQVDAA
jgi:hypothetical protein